MEKDIPSLPSLPAIDFSGLDESFQDPSASTFSIAALQRSLSKTPRPPSKLPSASPSLSNSRSHNPDDFVRGNVHGVSLSRHSDEMMFSDEESNSNNTHKSEIIHEDNEDNDGDEYSEAEEELESKLESEQSPPGNGGSLEFLDVRSGDLDEAGQSLRNEESYSVVRANTLICLHTMTFHFRHYQRST